MSSTQVPQPPVDPDDDVPELPQPDTDPGDAGNPVPGSPQNPDLHPSAAAGSIP